MATKKQKREEALAKREAFLAEERQHGLDAQKRAREEHEKEIEKVKARVNEINRRHRAILAANLIASGRYK